METNTPKTKSKPSGRNSILADIGSKINVIGADTDREFRETSESQGLEVHYEYISPPMKIAGVGKGYTECNKKGTCPIAVYFKHGGRQIHTFTAYVTNGHATHLPAIYCLDSMQDQDAVIILRKGRESIVFPGEKGYKIQWSEGSKVIPLVPAPSGHLVIECDKYEGAKPSTAGEAISFVTDHERGTAS